MHTKSLIDIDWWTTRPRPSLVLGPLWGRLRVTLVFQTEGEGRWLTRVTASWEALTGHLCPSPHLFSLHDSAFFLSEWLWSAFSLPLIRRWHQTKHKTHFLRSTSLQIIFKHLWSWQQQINKYSAAAPLSEPTSLWPNPLAVPVTAGHQTPPGEREDRIVMAALGLVSKGYKF